MYTQKLRGGDRNQRTGRVQLVKTEPAGNGREKNVIHCLLQTTFFSFYLLDRLVKFIQ